MLLPDGWSWSMTDAGNQQGPKLTSAIKMDPNTGNAAVPTTRVPKWRAGLLLLTATSTTDIADAYAALAAIVREYHCTITAQAWQPRTDGARWMRQISMAPFTQEKVDGWRQYGNNSQYTVDEARRMMVERSLRDTQFINIWGWVMSDGTQIAPGQHMRNGRILYCSACRNAVAPLVSEPGTNHLFCQNCVRTCPGTANEPCMVGVWDLSFSGCETHFPRADCTGCGQKREVATLQDHRGKPYCSACIQSLCQRCGVPGSVAHGTRPLVDGREQYFVCKDCQKAVVDWLAGAREEKLILEKVCDLHMEPHPARPVRLASIELEFASGAQEIIGELSKAGLTKSPVIAHHWQGDDTDFCYMEYDGSLPDGGGELIFSKIRMDDTVSAKKLQQALTIARSCVKKNIASVDLTTGCHIHIDAHKMGFNHIRNLVLLFNYLEDPIYRLSAAGYTRHRGVHYAMVLPKQNIDTQADFNRHFFRANQHHSVLNVAYFYNAVGSRCLCGNIVAGKPESCECQLGKCTVEFRVFNGTSSWRKLNAYMAICQSLVAYANSIEHTDVSDFPPCLYNAVGIVDAALKNSWYERLVWMFENLYFTEVERSNIQFCIEKSSLSELSNARRKALDEVTYQGNRYAPKPAKAEKAVNPYKHLSPRSRGYGQTTRSEAGTPLSAPDIDGVPMDAPFEQILRGRAVTSPRSTRPSLRRTIT